jgi:hypothetical protein
VYLASTSTHLDHDALLIDSGAYFHITPHREWFCEYEKYNEGEFILGDYSTTKITRHRKVWLLLKGGQVRTLIGVLQGLSRNLISMSKMGNVGVQTIFEKDTCKMIRGAMVLLRGV